MTQKFEIFDSYTTSNSFKLPNFIKKLFCPYFVKFNNNGDLFTTAENNGKLKLYFILPGEDRLKKVDYKRVFLITPHSLFAIKKLIAFCSIINYLC